jgi:hypothetical protein
MEKGKEQAGGRKEEIGIRKEKTGISQIVEWQFLVKWSSCQIVDKLNG